MGKNLVLLSLVYALFYSASTVAILEGQKIRAYTERFRAAERESRDLVGDKWS